jgi:hypothetical protein
MCRQVIPLVLPIAVGIIFPPPFAKAMEDRLKGVEGDYNKKST